TASRTRPDARRRDGRDATKSVRVGDGRDAHLSRKWLVASAWPPGVGGVHGRIVVLLRRRVLRIHRGGEATQRRRRRGGGRRRVRRLQVRRQRRPRRVLVRRRRVGRVEGLLGRRQGNMAVARG